MQKILLIVGALIVAIGLFWPWLTKLGLGNLPGDINIKGDSYMVHFPMMTSIVVSIVVSLLFYLFQKFR